MDKDKDREKRSLFVLTVSKSANYFGIFWGFFGDFFWNSLEHVGLSVLYMVGITVGILYMMSHDTNCGYKKILGLRGDRTGQDKNDH